MSAEQQEQKQIIIERLKEDGCRITKQRLMLLDIILEDECSSCKEIYYRASKKDPSIGTATVYRMINTLDLFIENSFQTTALTKCSELVIFNMR